MTGEQVGVTGRVIFFRNTGKLCFATLREGDAELQVMLSRDRVGEESLAAWKADVDLGDHVLVTGEVGTSRRGELSVFADSWQLTAKALRPLPVAHKPMSEELRVRRRYVDLIVRDEARRTVRQRATVMSTLRAGPRRPRTSSRSRRRCCRRCTAAPTARPFRTHMNAFDLDLYLRIAPELFLKRLHRRRAGPGLRDQPELPQRGRRQLALAGVRDARGLPGLRRLPGRWPTLTRELIQECVRGAVRRPRRAAPRRHRGRPVGGVAADPALRARSPRRSARRSRPETPVESCARIAERHDVGVDPAWVPGKVVEELFEALVQHTLQAPTFVIDYPVDTSPLTRAHRVEARPRREVGPLHRRDRAGHRLLRAGRPGRPARAVHRAGRCSPRPATPRRWRSTRTSSRRWSTACRPPAAWAWAWTG